MEHTGRGVEVAGNDGGEGLLGRTRWEEPEWGLGGYDSGGTLSEEGGAATEVEDGTPGIKEGGGTREGWSN